MYTWDKDEKVKLKGLPDSRSITTAQYSGPDPLPILDCAFNPQGTLLAVALGYDWAKGAAEYIEVANEILVHICAKDEVEKKSRGSVRK